MMYPITLRRLLAQRNPFNGKALLQVVLAAGVAAAALLKPHPAYASNNTRVSLPNALTLELGGRALGYSVNYDRVLSDQFLVGVGYGNTASSTVRSGQMIPMYVNYYFFPEAGSLYATVGASLVTSGGVSTSNSSASSLLTSSGSVLVSAGLGYEYRSDPGFLARLTGYLSGSIAPWVGISFGYSF